MERVKLRIRIPAVFPCFTVACTEVTRNLYCRECLLDAGVCEEVPPATLPRKIKVVHSTPLGCDDGCLGEVH